MSQTDSTRITCPVCQAKDIKLSARWCIGSHHEGIDSSAPIPVWEAGACQGVRLHPDRVFDMLLQRDIYGQVLA